MSIIPETIAYLWSGTPRPASRHLSIVILAVVLVSTTACGSSMTASSTDASTGTAVPSTNSIVNPASSVPEVPSTVTATTIPRPTATIDELVGAPGERVHIRCLGQSDTTVLLISGFGTGAEGWAAVEPAIAARTRVCSYERPGTGTSDPATSTGSFTTQATDLHALLSMVGEPGPYVVVGHSFGGAEAITFASLYADEVTGIALIDASPATWPAALCAVSDDGSDAAATLRAICGTFAPSGNSEQLDVVAAFAGAATIVSLGSLPMAVVTATHRELPADLAASEVDRLNEAWNLGQQDWMALSTAAHLVSVERTGHHIEIDQPGVVIDEISRLLP